MADGAHNPAWWSIDEVAVFAGVTPSYVRRLAREGVLAGVQEPDGRRVWRFNPDVVRSHFAGRDAEAGEGSWVNELLLAEVESARRDLDRERVRSLEAENAELRRRVEEQDRRIGELRAAIAALVGATKP